jgi:hypothetical protein
MLDLGTIHLSSNILLPPLVLAIVWLVLGMFGSKKWDPKGLVRRSMKTEDA